MQCKRRRQRFWWSVAGTTVLAAVIAVSLVVLAGGDDGRFTATSYADVIRFDAEGVATLQVRIFDLSGKEVWDSGVVAGLSVDWDRRNEFGERLAYGAYIYVAQGWSANGALLLQKKGKLALLPGDRVQLQVAPPVSLPGGEEGGIPSSGEPRFKPMAQIGSLSDTGIFGQVGIGTDTPAYKLHVLGYGATVEAPDAGANVGVNFKAASGKHAEMRLFEGGTQVGEWQWHGESDYMHFRTIGAYPIYFGANSGIHLTIDTDGDVGIGTTSPSPGNKLHVLGYGVTIEAPDAGANVGINFKAASGKHAEMRLFEGGTQVGEWQWEGTSDFMKFRTLGAYQIRFGVNSGNHLTIDTDGAIGINTVNPSATLEVHGSAENLLALYDPVAPTDPKFRVTKTGEVRADGAYYGASFNTGSADVAERINASEWVEAGCVVEIDPDHPGFFRKSRSPYSRRVAGVISTSPGVILGNSFDAKADKWEDNRPVLAIAGRVPVKATAENGPIQIGDLLVAASVAGYAMKGTNQRASVGAVVGKALEPLESGTGTIMAQVMLR